MILKISEDNNLTPLDRLSEKLCQISDEIHEGF